MSEVINSTADALKFLYGQSHDSSTLRFRGQAVADWPVLPSIHRFNDFERYQTVAYEDLILSYKPDHPIPPLTHTNFDLEWLMLCQHYGVPTRMLDWSREILVALLFACSDAQYTDADGALFVCDQNDYKLFSAYDKHAMEQQELAFVSTNIVNPRMRAQSGCFMIWGHSPLTTDTTDTTDTYDWAQYQAAQHSTHFWKKLTIPKESKTLILSELNEIYSINPKTFFLDGSYFLNHYGQRFSTLTEDARLMTLYTTAAGRLDPPSRKRARKLFNIDCEDMFADCIKLQSIRGLTRPLDATAYWSD